MVLRPTDILVLLSLVFPLVLLPADDVGQHRNQADSRIRDGASDVRSGGDCLRMDQWQEPHRWIHQRLWGFVQDPRSAFDISWAVDQHQGVRKDGRPSWLVGEPKCWYL